MATDNMLAGQQATVAGLKQRLVGLVKLTADNQQVVTWQQNISEQLEVHVLWLTSSKQRLDQAKSVAINDLPNTLTELQVASFVAFYC